MTALYNEIDPFAAEWLRQLILNGHIANGVVDERSIEDLEPDYVSTFTQVHFFAGIGVWSYALRNAGWSDETPVWTGSCPCQPFSQAGKGSGVNDERHLWPAMHWLIEQCKPDVVFGEQVASKDGLAWIDIVSSDLEGSGYAFGSIDTCAAGFGAPHIRQRLYWVGNASSGRRQPVKTLDSIYDNGVEQTYSKSVACEQASGDILDTRTNPGQEWGRVDLVTGNDGRKRPIQCGTFPLADGFTNRVGRLRGYGNAIVAPQAQAFIEAFMEYK